MKKKRKYTIKPKPTTFGGKKFRSRLEARWALLFYLCGFRPWYEVQLRGVPSGYLPDFFFIFGQDLGSLPSREKKLLQQTGIHSLHSVRSIVEIKPTPPNQQEKDCLKRYLHGGGRRFRPAAAIISGSPDQSSCLLVDPDDLTCKRVKRSHPQTTLKLLFEHLNIVPNTHLSLREICKISAVYKF